jgi:hypothetical protein
LDYRTGPAGRWRLLDGQALREAVIRRDWTDEVSY